MSKRPSTDLLSDLLETSNLRASVYANPQVCGQWRIDTCPHGTATFHFVVRGGAWLHYPDGTAPQPLRAGDLVVFPRDLPHSLADGPSLVGATVRPADGKGPVTQLICGQFDLSDSGAALLLSHLPATLVIESDAAIPGLTGLARLLANEAESTALGHQLVLDRLSDVLFVAILRYVVDRAIVPLGLLAALRDRRLAAALEAMTREPGAAWSLALLATRAGLSRASFAQHFSSTLGEPPMTWLARLRMDRAATLLRERHMPVADVAAALGYRTEAAFRRAFKRHHGVGPGALRRSASETPTASAATF